MQIQRMLRPGGRLLEYQVVTLPGLDQLTTLLWDDAIDGWQMPAPGSPPDMRGWRTDIWHIAPNRPPLLWGPGKNYPTGAMFAADSDGVLYGFDLLKPHIVHACRLDGSHVATFRVPMMLQTPLAPRLDADGTRVQLYSDGPGESRWESLPAIMAKGGIPEPTASDANYPCPLWRGPDEKRLAAWLNTG